MPLSRPDWGYSEIVVAFCEQGKVPGHTVPSGSFPFPPQHLEGGTCLFHESQEALHHKKEKSLGEELDLHGEAEMHRNFTGPGIPLFHSKTRPGGSRAVMSIHQG